MADTKFKPWQSWNPAWKPPWTRSVETLFRDAIAKIATDQSIEDVERDLVITLLAKAKKWDMRALEMYLDRLYGKPKQTIDNNLKWDISISSIEIIDWKPK
jgi:hypothetical protein